MKLIWTEPAVNSLQTLHDYIAKDNAFYAIRFIDRLTMAAERIPEFPLKGRQVPETDDENIREMIFQGYRIIYRIQSENAEILAVVHGSRDLRQSAPWDLG
ncbi:type II toxin-antitoxin system RelE/ParE family toxin [Candidatus Pacearchaeota archaeon]|nr:type II toxin-antitoxin system RelE/ParE family toxin [Candidatus Pacearchaeota archaeon]